jgi:hypothetical protein
MADSEAVPGPPLDDAVDAEYLTRLLHHAGHEGVEVAGFSREATGGLSHGGGQVQRLRLRLQPSIARSDPAAPTSLILKESRGTRSQALDPGFARREAECYRHDLFSGLGARLRIPKAYLITARSEDDRYWIWLEDLGAAFAVAWTPELLALACRDVAELHARWWGREREWSRLPFLRRRAQAMYDGLWSERIAANCLTIEGHPRERTIARVFTPDRRQLLVRLARAEEVVYPRLERLPQTLLHHDIWLPNLGRCDGMTALIDWSYVGPGTPGAELSQTAALMIQVWGPDLDERPLLESLYDGLARDWGLAIAYDELVAGYELCFCLRPAHALGGPILGRILSGEAMMVGASGIEERLAAAEATFQRIERGVRRL